MNPVIERATATIAREEVQQLLLDYPRADGKPWSAAVRRELIDRLRQAIDQAVQQEVEHIEGQIT